jgi:hypothetical protein
LSFLPRALSRLFPATGPGALFLNPWGFLAALVFPIAPVAMAVLISIYANLIYKLRKAVVDYDDGRGVRPDAAEHAGRKPASNADIERLLGLYDERP